MRGDVSWLGLFAFLFLLVIAVLWVGTMIRRGRREESAVGAPPPPPASLSILAGLSFLCGLGAILLVAATGILSLVLSMGDLLQLSARERPAVELAGRIVMYVSLLPAVAAMAFALAARGVISESRDTVRGRPLYRTGILLALLTGIVVFNAKILNPATWLLAGSELAKASAAGDFSLIDRGYLGVEPGPLESGCVSLLRVVPGSPAEKAGLKPGDIVAKLDGAPVFQLPPMGSPGAETHSSTVNYLGAYIGTLKPGSKVTLEIRRGNESLTIVAELSASYESLLELLHQQSLDDERMAVLKAAGADRRYSADELRRICSVFDLDSHRLKVIETALPRLQDPQNAYQILGALDFAASKRKVSEWIEAAQKPK